MTESDEQESILDNLNKTRQLWSSKADLGTADYLIPKSPISHTPAPNKLTNSMPTPNGNATVPDDVVRAEDQVVEDYELPNIKSMKSQWESPNSQNSSYVPMPTAKSPAAIARENSIKKENNYKPVEPVNRDEVANQEEPYEVELTKLKAQFESAAKAASKTRPKSPKTPLQNTAIKEQVSRSTSFKQKTSRSTTKKLRFEDEMTSTAEKLQTEERAESESLSVDLSSLKTQFESRKDQNPVTPQLSTKRQQPEKCGSKRPPQPQSPVSSVRDDTSCHSNVSESSRDEPVKSSEPMYDEMIGEESVKDRLLKYKSMTETPKAKVSVKRGFSQKREPTTVVKKVSESNEGEVFKEEAPVETGPEVVRSPPAGTRETPDYQPSVDLRQTKALFEKDSKSSARSNSKKRRSTASLSSVESATASPSRTGRSSFSGHSRSSSHHSRASSTSSKRSKSPAVEVNLTVSDSVPSNEETMSDVVKPPPAGTKETADYVPSVKVSSMKSMFEQPKNDTAAGSAAPPRRQLRDSDWANGNGEEANRGNAANQRVVSEGSFEDREGVVRPPTAGTKERPSYNLSSDFLKSRAAMFETPAPEQYTPRNKVNTKNENAPTEVVNAQSEESDLNYELSSSLKDTKKMFEDGNVSTDTSRKTPDDIVPAANLNSAKSVFENKSEEPTDTGPKEPIDLQQESEEVKKREQEVAAGHTQEPAQEPEEPAQEPEEPAQEPEEPSQEPEEPSQEPEEPSQEPEEPAQEPVEEPATKPESESETEGEYLLENNEAPPEEQAEDAAGVVPVRVAIPDAEENGNAPEQAQEEAAPEQQEEAAQSDEAQPEDPGVEQQKQVSEETPVGNGVEEEQAADGSSD